MFGSFEPERDEDPPRYGLTTHISSHNPAKVAMHEWLAMFRDVARAREMMNDHLVVAQERQSAEEAAGDEVVGEGPPPRETEEPELGLEDRRAPVGVRQPVGSPARRPLTRARA